MVKRTVPISEVRKELFDLFEEVTGDPDRVIVIQHRNREERAVLASERHWKALSDKVQARPFELAKSGILHVDPDRLLESQRRSQSDLARRKRGRL